MNQLKAIEVSHNMSTSADTIDNKLIAIFENINPATKRIVKHLKFMSIIVGCHPIALLFSLMTFFV